MNILPDTIQLDAGQATRARIDRTACAALASSHLPFCPSTLRRILSLSTQHTTWLALSTCTPVISHGPRTLKDLWLVLTRTYHVSPSEANI